MRRLNRVKTGPKKMSIYLPSNSLKKKSVELRVPRIEDQYYGQNFVIKTGHKYREIINKVQNNN